MELNDTVMAIRGYQAVIDDAEKQIARLRLDESLDRPVTALEILLEKRKCRYCFEAIPKSCVVCPYCHKALMPDLMELAPTKAVAKLRRKLAKVAKSATPAKRTMSASARARIAEAQVKRWAKIRRDKAMATKGRKAKVAVDGEGAKG